ncbi:MAG: PEGA domain-containing protein [Acidobacteriota bacterium]
MKKRLFIMAALAMAISFAAASADAAPRGGSRGGGSRGGWHRGGGTRIIIGGGIYAPYWGWGYGYGYPYYGYGGYYGGYNGGYGRGYRDGNWGSVKTDVEPEDARVYLDGKYIGTADDFDGWPDKLYLRPGHYRLEFRLNGYAPRVVEVNARAGAELKVDDKLPRDGSAISKADPPKLEGNVQRFFGKRRDRGRDYRGRDSVRPYAPGRETESYANSDSDEDVVAAEAEADEPDDDGDRDVDVDKDADRDRPAAAPAPRDESWRGAQRRPPDAAVSARGEARRDRGRLKISIEPSDAAVYIDDRFVGSADEVSSMDQGIVVAPGRHTVTVSRPGYRDKSREVEVGAGKTESIEISLAR